MNERSSRSHAIFTITLEQKELKGSELKKAKFHLVDLAGSENVKKTGAQGKCFKEGCNINKDLLVLGKVAQALTDKRHMHVPYRESKLTRILEDSLGGTSSTILLACACPEKKDAKDTLKTLEFASRLRQVKNKQIKRIQQLQSLGLGATAAASSEEAATTIKKQIKEIKDLEEKVEQLQVENTRLKEIQQLQSLGLGATAAASSEEAATIRKLTEQV